MSIVRTLCFEENLFVVVLYIVYYLPKRIVASVTLRFSVGIRIVLNNTRMAYDVVYQCVSSTYDSIGVIVLFTLLPYFVVMLVQKESNLVCVYIFPDQM